MKYRHEWKHEINYSDMLLLRKRLAAIMQQDSHAINGKYEIRSLYFDTPDNRALKEKENGISVRDKYRLRMYDGDSSYIALEKKSKVYGLCAKESCQITKEEVQRLCANDLSKLKDRDEALCKELYSRMLSTGLKPRTIVDYTREPFVFPAGNVRVTIDYNIRTGNCSTDFLNRDVITLPTENSVIILEVKWDEFLPEIISDAVNIPGRQVTAFSKYQQCRVYG